MTRASILQETLKAKIAHKRWVKRADHLISGLPVDKDAVPLEATSCGFGKWLYTQGSQLRNFHVTKHIIEELEFHHNDLHKIYAKIYDLYFIQPENRSLLHKITTFNNKKVTRKEKEMAKEYFEQLSCSSDKLLELMDQLDKASAQITYEQLTS